MRERAAAALVRRRRKPRQRSSVTEWAVTILIYLFATTTLVQAYVVPTGSMEGNLLVGDHMLVDRVAFADPGPFGRHILPYRDVERGDIVAFLYPEDIRQTYVKRVIGLPGDRIHLENGQVIRNGRRLVEPYTQHIAPYPDPLPRQFPARARMPHHAARTRHVRASRAERRSDRAAGNDLRHGRQPRQLRRQPLLGIRAARAMWSASRCWSTGRTTRPPPTCRSGPWIT